MMKPVVGRKYRAETSTSAAQTVIIEVTAIVKETDSHWTVYGYRQYKNRRNGVRATSFPTLYFIPKEVWFAMPLF